MPPKERKSQKGKKIRTYINNEWSISKDGFVVIFEKGLTSRKQIIAQWKCDDVTNDKNSYQGEEEGTKLNFMTTSAGKQRVYLNKYCAYKDSDVKLDRQMKLDKPAMSKS